MWIKTEYYVPSWNGATKWISTASDLQNYIVWDGMSRFYARSTERARFFSVHFVVGKYPELEKDTEVMQSTIEKHYVGVALQGLTQGYKLGTYPKIDDGK